MRTTEAVVARLDAGAHRWAGPRPVPASPSALGAARVVVGLGALAVLAQLAGTVVSAATGFRYDGINPDEDGNVFTWASSLATGLLAFSLLLLALQLRRRAAVLVAAALVAFFSLDDAVMVHERISRLVFVDGAGLTADYGARLWPVLYAPLFAVVAVVLLVLARTGRGPAWRLTAGGLALLVTGVVAELVSAVLTGVGAIRYRTWPDALLAGLEEGVELAGWVLLVAAATVLVLSGAREDAAG